MFKKFIKENKFYLIFILVMVVLFNIKLPYYIDAPGGVININDRIECNDRKDLDIEGSFNMLYVTEYRATIPTYLLSYILRDWDIEKISQSRISNETALEMEIRNKIMLSNSLGSATYAAYKALGRDIKISNYKNIVIGTTLDNGLKIGDQVISIDGNKVVDLEDIKRIILEHDVGDKLIFKIIRDNKKRDIEVEIRFDNNEKVIGALIVTDYEYDTEDEVDIHFKESESGASGGLMMAISIYQAIGNVDLLQGRNIAGTGTIDRDGNVGAIDGIKYKIIGAYKNHMDIVLVPSGNYREALKVVEDRNYDMKVVEIKTLKEAIEYLRK